MSPVPAPALTLVFIFIAAFLSLKCWYRLGSGLVTNAELAGAFTSFDAGLNLQSLGYRLIVLHLHKTSFNAALDLQTASHRLVVVPSAIRSSTAASARFHIRFDFHSVFLSLKS